MLLPNEESQRSSVVGYREVRNDVGSSVLEVLVAIQVEFLQGAIFFLIYLCPSIGPILVSQTSKKSRQIQGWDGRQDAHPLRRNCLCRAWKDIQELTS